jgi:hypothetical protein
MSGAGERLREAVAALAFSPETDEALVAAVGALRAACGDSLDGLVFFGSRRTGAANANAWSAYDLFAVVPAYRPFYAALARAGLSGKRPWLLAAISPWLAPTQVSLRFEPPLHAKVSVIRRDALQRETSGRRHDHFTIGRLFQPVRILGANGDASREALLSAVVSAHAETWSWSRPWLAPEFSADEYGQRVLEVSMGFELRPEPSGRAGALWVAQRALQQPVFRTLLEDLESAGNLARRGPDRWAIIEPVTAGERIRLRFYFILSMARATLRWSKHILSFEGWLDYIVRKASRHTGEAIELTPRERRWPLVFLWGRVFRHLREKNQKGNKA